MNMVDDMPKLSHSNLVGTCQLQSSDNPTTAPAQKFGQLSPGNLSRFQQNQLELTRISRYLDQAERLKATCDEIFCHLAESQAYPWACISYLFTWRADQDENIMPQDLTDTPGFQALQESCHSMDLNIRCEIGDAYHDFYIVISRRQ